MLVSVTFYVGMRDAWMLQSHSLWNCIVSCRLMFGAAAFVVIQAVIWFVPGFIVYVLLLNVMYCVWYVAFSRVNVSVTV